MRKNYIIVFKIKADGEDLLQKAIQTLNNLLHVNLEQNVINNIYRIGKKANSPVVIEFVCFIKKISLFKNKENTKKLKEQSISIANDLCKEDRVIRKKLRKHLKQASKQNLDAKIRLRKINSL